MKRFVFLILLLNLQTVFASQPDNRAAQKNYEYHSVGDEVTIIIPDPNRATPFCLRYAKHGTHAFVSYNNNILPYPIKQELLSSFLQCALTNFKSSLDSYATSHKEQFPLIPDFLETLRLSCGPKNRWNREILMHLIKFNYPPGTRLF